ncbi:hypothetical protein AAFF_G00318550 [Aldrovandia affinis]|uniref:Uncharacterized protein n=1 Tax=Aldrovandia affinis TaxID=143900 RepID=A0AAD7SNP7_9TELE|nr:hypothetical protein AAFF_G00318550 [Aldrovandia affinis]
MDSVAPVFALLSVLYAFWTPCVWSQGLKERDALCNEDGCFVVYFQRKTFLESWRSCKEKGGNLATVKRPEEARQIEELLSGAERRGSRARVRVWIGLQRQPRQCSATRPLRGFSWTTGDQDTQYTNWLREDLPNTCSVPRCVVMTYSTATQEQQDNYKWLDGSCSLPVDGFLCRYIYDKGMCQAIPGEGGAGPVLYSTPFHLLSTLLTHVPFDSIATVPCPDGTKGDQSVKCSLREDGSAGWHRDSPLCTEAPQKSWCQEDNSGCQHLCWETSNHYYCECYKDFLLAEDMHTCVPLNPCQDASCEFECIPSTEGYRCMCPEGYLLAPDGLSCLDKDECLESPCEQACENTPGSYACHCHLGYSPLPEDPSRCQDIDECQIPGSCEHMCLNYFGGFQCHCREGYELQPDFFSCWPIPTIDNSPTTTPSFPWVTSLPERPWLPQVPDWFPQLPEGDWSMPLDWLTDPPSLEGIPTDLTLFTDVPLEGHKEQAEEGELGKQEEQEEQGKQEMQEEQGKQEEQEQREEQEVQDEQEEYVEQEEQGEQEEPKRLDDEVTQSWTTLHQTELGQLALTSSPSATSTPEWLEDESTPSPTAPLTPTPGGGAWNWLWYSLTPAAPEENIRQGGTVSQSGEGSHSEFGNRDAVPPLFPTSSPEVEEGSIPDDGVGDRDEVGVAPLTPEPGTEGLPESDSNQQQNSNWLLIAILVPLCIFVVVMVALGIVYCTRCTVRTRNKNKNDCYHWISGANDKTGGTGTAKTHV